MTFFRKIQKYLSSLLLFALFTVMYNNAVNLHRHVLPNEQILVHAHFFSKSQGDNPQKEHKHTANQLLVIAQINFLFSFLLIIFFIFQFIRTKFRENLVSFILEIFFSSSFEINYQLRAPPFD